MLKNKNKKLVWAAGLASVALLLSACSGGGDESADSGASGDAPVEIRVADSNMDGEIGPIAFDEWADAVEEASDGSISVDVFHGSQLVTGPELVTAMNDGRAEAGYLIADFNPEEFPLWGGASLPFVTMDPYAQADAYQYMYENNEMFQAEFNEAGVHMLAFFPVQPGLIALGEGTQVNSLDELSGMSLRAFGWWGTAIEGVGAVPVFFPTNELVENLERGVVDGVVGQSVDPLVDRGMHEMAPNMLQTGMGMYVGTAFGISLELWDSLSADQQAVLTDASAQMKASYERQYDDLQDHYCEALEETGGTVTVFSEADQAAFSDEVKDSLHQQWREGAIAAGNDEAAVDEFWNTYTEKIAEFEAENNYTDIVTYCTQ